MHSLLKDWHLINYVITKKRDLRDINITHFFHATCCLSDHSLLCSKASFCLAHRRLQKTSAPKQMNTMALKIISKTKWVLQQAGHCSQCSNDIESSWKTLRDTMHTASLELFRLPVQSRFRVSVSISSIPRHCYAYWWEELEVCKVVYIFRK